MSKYQEQRIDLELKIAELQSSSNRMRSIQSRSDSITLEAQLDAAKDALERVSQNIAVRQLDLDRLPDMELEYSAIMQKRKDIIQALSALQQDYIRANVSEAVTLSEMRIIDEAIPPSLPSGPKVIPNVIFSMFLSFVLGGVGIMIAESLYRRIRSIEDLPKAYIVDGGTLPSVVQHSLFYRKRILPSTLLDKHFAGAASRIFSASPGDVLLFVSADNSKGHVDNIRHLFSSCQEKVMFVTTVPGLDGVLYGSDGRTDRIQEIVFVPLHTPGIMLLDEQQLILDAVKKGRTAGSRIVLLPETITSLSYSDFLRGVTDTGVLFVNVNCFGAKETDVFDRDFCRAGFKWITLIESTDFPGDIRYV
jgi:hypothetical protein